MSINVNPDVLVKMTNMLKEKDKRIAALEKENKNLQEKSERLDERATKNFNAYMRCSSEYTDLKQQLKSLPKKICEEIRGNLSRDYSYLDKKYDHVALLFRDDNLKFLNEIQAKYEKECGDVKN